MSVGVAYLGLGSNLGDRRSHLDGALAALRELDADLRVSPLYETAPVGGPTGQPAYLNCVVRLTTDLSPEALLRRSLEIEAAAGRVREERWGPRTLDVDLLIVEGESRDTPELVLPHPRLEERAFVLAPLADLAPGLVPSDWQERFGGAAAVASLVRRLEETAPSAASRPGTAP